MRKYKTRKNLLFSIILLLVLIIGIGYAYLTSNLSILGQAEVASNTWDIHFENLVVSDGSITAVSPAVIDTNETTVNFSIKLERPGDFYEFVVDAVNDGSLDGMLGSINNVELTASQLQYLNYSFTYSDGANINTYDQLLHNTSETFKLRIEYKNDISASDLPSTNQILSLSISLNYTQSNSNARERDIVSTIGTNKNNIVLGDYIDIGTNILGTSTVIGNNESVTSDFRVFNKDEDGITVILADYLPGTYFDVTSVNLSYNSNYNIASNVSRMALIDGLNNSNWINLINGSNVSGIIGVIVKGTPTLETWVNSWNSNTSFTTLYTKEKTPVMGDGLIGYYIGVNENPNGANVNISGSTGYSNSLFFPHKTVVNSIQGYLLANPSASAENEIFAVKSDGRVNGYDNYDDYYNSVRPVVYLPNSIRISQENNIWVVNE